MDNLLSEGLGLLVFGMGFVFVFLTVLVLVTGLMSKLVVKFEPAPAPKAPKARPATGVAPSTGNDDQLIAVLTAAVHKYRS